MIFSTKNEDNIPAWQLVLDGRKTVTRRLRPQPVGALRAVQPKRTAKGIGFIRIKSCIPHKDWWDSKMLEGMIIESNIESAGACWCPELELEAKREGFLSLYGLLTTLKKMKVNIMDTQRIEFELLSGKERGHG